LTCANEIGSPPQSRRTPREPWNWHGHSRGQRLWARVQVGVFRCQSQKYVFWFGVRSQLPNRLAALVTCSDRGSSPGTVQLTCDRHCLCGSTGRSGVPQALSALIPDDGGLSGVAFPDRAHPAVETLPNLRRRCVRASGPPAAAINRSGGTRRLRRCDRQCVIADGSGRSPARRPRRAHQAHHLRGTHSDHRNAGAPAWICPTSTRNRRAARPSSASCGRARGPRPWCRGHPGRLVAAGLVRGSPEGTEDRA